MIQVKEIITVNQPVETVFKFVSNFRFIEQWDPGVVASVKVSQGAVQKGTDYKLNLRYGLFNIETIYTIIDYDPPFRVVLQGRGESFDVTDTILFSQLKDKTRIEYTAALEFKKPNPTTEIFLKPLFSYIGKKAMNGLKKALAVQRHPARPATPMSGIKLIDTLADSAVIPGMLGFSKWGFNISKKSWKANPCFLTGKNVVITGATSGIGKVAAFALAERDANLTLVARNREKAIAIQQEIIALTGNENIDFFIGDLSLMADIKEVTRQIAQEKTVIDVLINNAGALFSERMETSEGFEKTFVTDLLGVFFLTRQLTDLLSNSKSPRIINISSGGMYTEKIDCDDLQNRVEPFNGAKAYARAKRGVVILTEKWAKSLESKGFRVHAMHPGWVDTPGLALSLPRFHKAIRKILRSPEQGADTIVWLASANEPNFFTGGFWLDRRLHTTHVFKHTRESEQEREDLLKQLTKMADLFS